MIKIALCVTAIFAGTNASARLCDVASLDVPTGIYSDPAMLAGLLAAHRSGLQALSVEFDVTTYQGTDVGELAWMVRWDATSFVVQASRGPSGGLHRDGSRRIWNGGTPDGDPKSAMVIWFDPTKEHGGECELTEDPAKVHFGEVLPEFCFLLGMFPTRTLVSGQPLANDLLAVLQSPGVSILPEAVGCEGHACRIIEGRRNDGSRWISIALSPELGGAVVRTETIHPDGRIAARWTATEFWQPEPDRLALPLAGVSQVFGGQGEVVIERQIRVRRAEDGSPLLLPALGPSPEDFVVPEGFRVTNLDTGQEWIASSSSAAAPPAWANAGVGSLAALSVSGVLGLIAMRRTRGLTRKCASKTA